MARGILSRLEGKELLTPMPWFCCPLVAAYSCDAQNTLPNYFPSPTAQPTNTQTHSTKQRRFLFCQMLRRAAWMGLARGR